MRLRMKMPLSRLIDYTPSPEGAVVCLLTCVPKWNMSQILVEQMVFVPSHCWFMEKL